MSFWNRWFRKQSSPVTWKKISDIQPGPTVHPRLTAEQTERIARIHQHLAPVDGVSLEERTAAFQRDVHIDQELLLAEVIILACEAANANFPPLSREQKREIYGLATLGTMAPAAEVLARYPARKITPSQARQVLAWVKEAMNDLVRIQAQTGPVSVTIGKPVGKSR